MTILGLGLAALGRPAYINVGHGDDFPDGRDVDSMRGRAHAVLDLAWDSGVRHLDVARSYGRAEEFVGDWLRDHPGRRDELTLGSKWGYSYVAGWQVDVDQHEVKDHSAETFARQWPETLEALGASPDFYLIHSVTPDSPALGDTRLLGALGELADTGVRVGLSTSGPEQAAVIAHALDLGGANPFTAVQSTWNLLEPSCGQVLVRAYEHGWHVALKETVANGRLTARVATPGALDTVAARHGTEPDAVAVAAALGQPASVALVGPATTDQLTGNLAGGSVSLTDQDLLLLDSLREEPQTYWHLRSGLPWN